jgi:SAM-dependent methyltransferase
MDSAMYGRFARVYDRLMEQMPYADWLAFLEACFARYGKPRSIVDLGCGTGNLAIPLAGAGYRVLGIDLSEDMLDVARRKAAKAGVPPETLAWSCQDMREWRVEKPADCVFSFCDCLNYLLEEEDIRRVFRRTFDGLAPGGLFAFDVHAPARMPAYAEDQPYVWDEDGLAYIWTCEYDPERIAVEHHLTFFVREDADEDSAASSGDSSADSSGGIDRYVRFREVHRQRAYMPDFLSDELRRAGFIVLDRCADFAWQLPDEESERIFFVARKPI